MERVDRYCRGGWDGCWSTGWRGAAAAVWKEGGEGR